VQRRWDSERIYEKVKEHHSHDPDWFFLDGPPYASGAIHIGTAWNKIIKDVVMRYRGMRGFNVRRQPGWDCHGLPIEVMVEKKLEVKTKKDIETVIGIERFIEECRKWATEHVDLMGRQFKRLGVWMDWGAPYLTLADDFIESAWWTLKQAHERGLMRKELRVIQWCPRCETALAEHEVRGEYQDVKDPSLYARFKLVYSPNEYILIWTTTPWTLPTNMAVCVHPDSHYAKVQVGEDTYIMAESLVSKVMDEIGVTDYRMLDLVKGKELEGLRYEHPMLEEVPKQGEFRGHHQVICGEHVTLEDGTGCVHTAPGHGQEDFDVGAKYGLPVFSPVGADGKFTPDAGKYAGKFVKDADPEVLADLERKGVLLKKGTILHSYPHCWRCKTALIFRATDQWFLRVSDIKSQILERNAADVKWFPDWVATRYVNGVESVGDWCISRQRYWGIPLPIWVCGNCSHEQVVGSREELARLSERDLSGLDLHRPRVDEVVMRCSLCSGEMKRTPDVLDVWFDSGIASWASLGYPRRRDEFERYWPGDFITEGEDQVTKWFYSQQVASVISFGGLPYKQVLMHGFALDEEGRKMSKSLGNVVDPL
ncbi:MAG: isoleucine--tRNA ligase, partial [Planctomycetes bacterium]|nr:isoleucine--tRNA ligase [Planctomycetota bacterium]